MAEISGRQSIDKTNQDKNDVDASQKTGVGIPSISLPKGGGAISGVGEKFSSNPFNGTCSLTVPIFTTPSRSDFYPKLSLSYDSAGMGNGPFGLGWDLTVPPISRKTEKGLPKYQDAIIEEANDSDTFILSGAEDLVPALVKNENGSGWSKDIKESEDREYVIQRYKPRIEGLFALIEKWRNKKTRDIFWRSISKDNVISLYGRSPSCRISDPGNDSHIFNWLLEVSSDDKGNVIVYEYKQENEDNVDRKLIQEKNRLLTNDNNTGYANRYIKRIKYGNRTPNQRSDWITEKPEERTDWLFEVVFDYGEHDIDNDSINETALWLYRSDPFSNYRSGFEIRTQRLCKRILMFHHFEELGDTSYLVSSSDFNYTVDPLSSLSFLQSITKTGYIKQQQHNGSNYRKKSTAPLEFTYTEAKVDKTLHVIDSKSLENLPIGLDGTSYRWLDLYSEGISGILTEQSGAWFYKHNLGNAKFAPTLVVAEKPSLSSDAPGSNQQEILDLAGDGHKYLVQFSGAVKGFYELSKEEEVDKGHWESFKPFESLPNINWQDPNLKFIDLDGDGRSDILVSEDSLFYWYPSKSKKGFGTAEFVRKSYDEEKGPAIVFFDSTQSIYLADMTGDGLSDIVRIRNSEVCYWPNIGYGRFGAKVTMGNSPIFDYPDQFNQNRIRLGDINGSGTTDLIYFSRDGVRFWLNQSGNSWSTSKESNIANFPAIDNLSSVMVIDLLGNGTSCLVWSSPLPDYNNGHQMQYIDLMGGIKPHLLKSIKNNMGSETRIQYASSTKFYLDDLAAGKPWITKLPFPVHVVERIETYDYLINTKLVSLSTYHHGYYDSVEREYRGFGLVEQWDSESFDQFHQIGLFSGSDLGEEHNSGIAKEEGLHVPPVHTKTWFHTGAYVEERNISQHFIDEYYKGDPQAIQLPDTSLPNGLNSMEKAEACRALKGQMLRQEVYAEDDNISQRPHPYTVSEHNYQIRILQPMQAILDNDDDDYDFSDDRRHAVFFIHDREVLDFHYERVPNDPRIQHQFVLQVDEYGNLQRQITVYYPRRSQSGIGIKVFPEQSSIKGVLNLTDYAKIVDKPDIWITGQIYQSKSLEISGLALTSNNKPQFQFPEIDSIVTTALHNILDFGVDFTDGTTTMLQARIFHWERMYYWGDNGIILPLGEIGSPVLLNRTETAVFPLTYANEIYDNQVITDQAMKDEGGYRQDSGYWWGIGTRQYYLGKGDFYLPNITVGPIGSFDPSTMTGEYYHLEYDYRYHLNPIKFTDPLGNVIQADIIDYRVVKPRQVIDINGNTSQVYYDELSMVIASTVFGSVDGVPKGDGNLFTTLGFQTFPDPISLNDIIANPQKYIQNATSFFYYDYLAWLRDKLPCNTIVVKREVHQSDERQGEQPQFQFTIMYTDGSARQLQKKIKVEGGLAWIKQPYDESYIENNSDERWLTSGRTVYNNKGKPVKQYEPFYSASAEYEFEKSLTEFGVTPVIYYDPLERVIHTDTPKGFFSSMIFDPWKQEQWDENDNVKESRFYDELINQNKHPPSWTPERIAAEKRALDASESHAYTPRVIHLNSMAQSFLEIDYVDGNQLFNHYDLDINSNKLTIADPRQYSKNQSRGSAQQIKTFRFSYDMENRQLLSKSADAGVKKSFQNVLNNIVYVWTSRNFLVNTKYDALQRSIQIHVKGNGLDNTVEKIQYGESVVSPEKKNLRGKPVKHNDQAGIKEFLLYDIEGHNIKLKTRLRNEYKKEVNWSVDPEPLSDAFSSEVTFDALNRLCSRKQSDQSTHHYVYHQSGLFKSVTVELDPGNGFKNYVNDIQYNAKGQRVSIEYGNGTITKYEYEKETFRLESLKTARSSDSKILQDILYVYDPVGNITYMKDSSHRTVFSNESKVDPVSTYTYDSIYRLKQANGRQHPAIMPDDYKNPNAFKESRYLSFDSVSINDSTALENYSQSYQYDFADNLEQIRHSVQGNSSRGWTKTQSFADDSNRIKSSTIGNDTQYFSFDAAGNMTKLEHLRQINWNYRDNISSAVLIQRLEDTAKNDAEYYVYDSDGMRVKKVLERYMKIGDIFKFLDIAEKIYIDGYEIKHSRRINLDTGELTPTLERLSCHVMDDKKHIAIIHRWEIDKNNRETDDLTAVKIHYQLGNHLDSVSLEIDDKEEIISYEEYYPYGETAFIAGNSLHSSMAKEVSMKDYRYTAKERDDVTGLYYHGARYYITWIGRWASCDPEMTLAGLNIYVYVSDNPLRYTDQTGGWNKDIHFLAVYLTGRLAGADYQTALRGALASQSLDDYEERAAPNMKEESFLTGLSAFIGPIVEGYDYNPAATRDAMAKANQQMAIANASHALGVSEAQAETVAKLGISQQNISLFGYGLHTVGDLYSHRNLNSIFPTFGHQNWITELGTISLMWRHEADYTNLNLFKALATINHFSSLWSEYLHNDPTKTDKEIQHFLDQFVSADTLDKKILLLKQFGTPDELGRLNSAFGAFAEIHQIIKLTENDKLRKNESEKIQGTSAALTQANNVWVKQGSTSLFRYGKEELPSRMK